MPRALLEDEPAAPVEGQRGPARHQVTDLRTDQIGPPTARQAGALDAPQQLLQVGPGGQQGRVDLEIAGPLLSLIHI